jgi:hypothetical protein
MTDIHLTYVGYFERNAQFAGFAEAVLSPKTGLAEPKVRVPLDEREVDRLASQVWLEQKPMLAWRACLEKGYMVFGPHCSDELLQVFISRLESQLNCDILDGHFRLVSADKC